MPHGIATCMYYTGMDPFTSQEVVVARRLRDRKLQRALMQFFKPENYFLVREALLKAGRGDYVHTIPNPVRPKGYRPRRKTAQRRDRR